MPRPFTATLSLFFAVVVVAFTTSAAPAAEGRVDLPRFPSISPDGTQIVFSWHGDLWKVPAAGGSAARLTANPEDDLHSAWSPDGKRIAFDSDRNGFHNLFLMNTDGTDLRQVTRLDRPCSLQGFGVDPDGEPVLTLTASIEGDMFRSPRPYMVSVRGGDVRRLHDAFGSEAVISPDGTRVAFIRGGSAWSRRHYQGPDQRDVWMLDRRNGAFTHLTTWMGNDGQPAWAGNDAVIFLSDRELNTVNLYRMNVSDGERSVRRLTAFDQADVQNFDVAADGSRAVMVVWDTIYTLDLRVPGGKSIALDIAAASDESELLTLRTINRDVTEAALSPDGKVMAMVAFGEVYIRNVEDKSPTRRVTESPAWERDIAWSPDGLRLYFVSDRTGTESIYAATVALTRSQVREPAPPVAAKPATREHPVAAPAAPGSPPAASTRPTEAGDPPAAAPGAEPTAPAANEPPPAEPSKTPAPAPKKDAVNPALDPARWHEAVTFTITPVITADANDREPTPSPDGKHLSFRRDLGDLMIVDLTTDNSSGQFAVGQPRRLVAGWDPGLNWRWSPDSSMIAYQQDDMDFNADIWIVPADGSAPAVNITRHPNNDVTPRWSADGKMLSFLSQRVDDQFDVWTVSLDKSIEGMTPKELDEYYKKAVEAAKKRKPVAVGKPKREPSRPEGIGRRRPAPPREAAENEDDKNNADDADKDKEKEKKDAEPETPEKPAASPPELSLQDAYLRLKRLTTLPGNEGNLEMTPGGDRLLFTAAIGSDTAALYSIKWDGTERRQITGNVRVQHISLTGDKVVFVADGRAGMASPAGGPESRTEGRAAPAAAAAAGGGAVEYVEINDRIRIDLREQAGQKFLEAARILGQQFYSPTMNGVDWPALTNRYHELAIRTRTASEFNDVANRFLGELNGSHLGIAAREEPSPLRQPQGRLGTIHQRVRGEPKGYLITAIVPESPVAKSPIPIHVGDVITAVDEQPFADDQTLESSLEGRVGKETLVTFARTADGQAQTLRALLVPIGFAEELDLKQRARQRRTVEQVDQWSGGRVGYINIEGMNQQSLDEFERDLYAAAGGRKGLIIDVRNNGGGWTTDRLLSSIMVQPHAYTIPRGGDPKDSGHYPQDRLFIQRYTLPINMLCNEKSFSNAEIISHAFKTLKRGSLVGQQTYGGVISTGGTTLLDGTTVRIPGRGWFLPDGTNMELHGAMPDVVVTQTPEAESRNEDEQLKAAVDDLLKRIQ